MNLSPWTAPPEIPLTLAGILPEGSVWQWITPEGSTTARRAQSWLQNVANTRVILRPGLGESELS